MSRNSGGTFTRVAGALTGPIYEQEYAIGTNVNYQSHDAEHNDIATELTDSLSRSGKGAMLANLAMGSFKITGLANGTASGDAVHYGQFVPENYAATATVGVQSGGGSVSLTTITAFQVLRFPGAPVNVVALQFETTVAGTVTGIYITLPDAPSALLAERQTQAVSIEAGGVETNGSAKFLNTGARMVIARPAGVAFATGNNIISFFGGYFR